MLNSLILKGAYGRKYATKALMIADWKTGKDFKIENGQYISIREIKYVSPLDTIYLSFEGTLINIKGL